MASGFRDVAVGGVVSHRVLFPQVKGHAIIGGCDVVHRTGTRRDEIVGSIVGQEEVLPAALLWALILAWLRCRQRSVIVNRWASRPGRRRSVAMSRPATTSSAIFSKTSSVNSTPGLDRPVAVGHWSAQGA